MPAAHRRRFTSSVVAVAAEEARAAEGRLQLRVAGNALGSTPEDGAAVVALRIDGVGPAEAEKFVRLCTAAGGGDATRLSKGKAKAACRSVRSKASGLPPLDLAEVESMQRAVLDCYGVSERVPTEESSEAAGDEARVE